MTTYTLTGAADDFPEVSTPTLQNGDVIEALGGDDEVSISVSGITVFGGDGADDIQVTLEAFASFESQFFGGGGADTIEIRGRNHTVEGGDGNDALSIIGRDSVLSGGAGDDRLWDRSMPMQGYTSIFNGDAGDDTMIGSGAASTFRGGSGNDVYWLRGSETLVETASGGTDTVRSYLESYTLRANFENLILNSSAVNGIGNSAANIITGNLRGNALTGSGGADRLVGGGGRDVLTGGSNRDTFDFNALSDTGLTASTRDVIADFTRNYDKIDVSSIDASTGGSGNNRFTFVGASAFSKKAGELRAVRVDGNGSSTDRTVILGDVNGDGKADLHIELTGLKSLASIDFVL